MASGNRGISSSRGIALLLVLGALVLVSVLILAFLGSVKTDLKSSKLYANGSSVKTLADSAVNLVTGQIRQATSGEDNGKTVAWASQPGMIRTYSDSGQRLNNYKLYSWDTLVTPEVFDPAGAAESVPGDWFDQPALFVDLNAPVQDSNGSAQYPILNPPPQTAGSKYYVEGFSVQGAPVQSSSGNSVPMPVKWLYVLENGDMVAPAATGTPNQVRVAGSDKSPIVGRMAFWTDDETCKINLNTASEGNFWDTPRAQGVTDFNIAAFQPVQNEYQRYPGHPATTCLSPVLGSLFPVDHSLQAKNTMAGYNPASPATYGPYKPYYDLAPKLNRNSAGNLGSQAGTATSYGSAALKAKADRLYASVDELLFRSNLVADDTNSTTFDGTRHANDVKMDKTMLEKARFFLTVNSRAPDVNLFNRPRVLSWPVHASNSPAYRTPFDQAIAFCGEIGKNGAGTPLAYYFQRQRNDHPTNDLPAAESVTGLGRNRMLLQYLQDMTSRPIPGFGGNFQAKYPGKERDQILVEIFDYVRCLNLNDKSFAAMTHPFAPVADPANGYPTKYAKTLGNGSGTGWTQLAANAGAGQVVPIYDTVNGTKGFGRFPTISEVALIFVATGWNDGAGGKGTDVNYQTDASGAVMGYNSALPPGNIQVRAALLINFFDPSQGNVENYGTYSVQVEGLDALQWGANSGSATPMGFPSNPANVSQMFSRDSNNIPQCTTVWGGNMGFRSFFTGHLPDKAPGDVQYYPFFSGSQNFPYDPNAPRGANPDLSGSPGTFYFSGGPVKIHLLLPTNTPGWPVAGWPVTNPSGRVPIQSIALDFSPATLPLPIYPRPADHSNGYPDTGKQARSFYYRFQTAANKFGPNPTFIVPQDTVRSLRAYPGDIRMIAGKPSISAAEAPGYFDMGDNNKIKSSLANWDYHSQTRRLVHSLREGNDYPFYGALLGQLVPGVAYGGQPGGGNPFADYSSGLNTFCAAGNNATAQGAFIGGGTGGMPGDWDNGFGYTADGPYINKADEGNLNNSYGKVPYFGNSTYYTEAGVTYFSPNRLMPSPGMFGSLPTGVVRNIPWQTLLFCPNPAAGPAHPGFGEGTGTGPDARAPFSKPPDYLLLDFFTMPVVEPYPISEPLSTAGRINMNYQIVPFTYITRNTGLRAVLKAERMTVIPDSASSAYKQGGGTEFKVNSNYDYRVPINADETLKGFDHYFSSNKDIFRSSAQICGMFLYPDRDAPMAGKSGSGPKWDAAHGNILNFWNGNSTGSGYSVSTSASAPTHYLTGDNSRERPYVTLYPRLTTKSNTYLVHVYVQTLKKAKDSSQDVWTEGRDLITGEYRGSSAIERFVDPNEKNLPDFAATAASEGLGRYYKYRVLNSTQFAP